MVDSVTSPLPSPQEQGRGIIWLKRMDFCSELSLPQLNKRPDQWCPCCLERHHISFRVYQTSDNLSLPASHPASLFLVHCDPAHGQSHSSWNTPKSSITTLTGDFSSAYHSVPSYPFTQVMGSLSRPSELRAIAFAIHLTLQWLEVIQIWHGRNVKSLLHSSRWLCKLN